MNFQHQYLVVAALCFSFTQNISASPADSTAPNKSTTDKQTGEIYCLKIDEHPVCQSTYKVNPSGTLGNSGISTGTAIVNGIEVKYTCYAGSATHRQPRRCVW